jgi:hypothetical protein
LFAYDDKSSGIGEFDGDLIPEKDNFARFSLDFRLRFCYSQPPKRTRSGGKYQLWHEAGCLKIFLI